MPTGAGVCLAAWLAGEHYAAVRRLIAAITTIPRASSEAVEGSRTN
jgi:hypothetical protein